MKIGALIQWSAFVLAGLAGTAAIVGAVAPDVAPSVMTMGTMSDAMDINRYQDRGTCDFWVTNMSNPTERIERDFACSFYWDWSDHDDGTAYIHEALYDKEKEQIFQVPNMDRGVMEEWYHVDGHMLTDEALAFQVSDEAGVLMPPPKSEGNLTMGWVTSGGQHSAPQKLLIARDLQAVGTAERGGLETVHWNSTVDRERVTWHGYDVYMTEHVDMYSDPKTAWVMEMKRHVKVEMTPSQMAAAFGQPVPAALDQDGDPEPVMELTYRTTPGAIDGHAAQSREFRQMMWPIENGDTLKSVGVGAGVLFGVAGLATRSLRSLFTSRAGGAGAAS